VSEKILAQFMSSLTAAGEVIGTNALRIWPQVVGITYVQSVFYVAVACVLILVGLVALGVGIRAVFKGFALYADADAVREERQDGRGGYEAYQRLRTAGDNRHSVGIPLIIGAVIVIIGSTLSLPDNLPGVFYPEAKTVMNIVKAAK
jgi:hypothetical protein